LDQFIFYLGLGWDHIISMDAQDHQLFLMALVAPFTKADGKKLLLLITAFTLGHCLTLALSSSGSIRISSYVIELLIPASILITALFQLYLNGPTQKSIPDFRTLFSMAGLFGLVHGLGFANTLKSMLGKEDSILIPLAGFNFGLELGQILVLGFLLALNTLYLKVLPSKQKIWVLAISILAGLGSTWMIWERV